MTTTSEGGQAGGNLEDGRREGGFENRERGELATLSFFFVFSLSTAFVGVYGERVRKHGMAWRGMEQHGAALVGGPCMFVTDGPDPRNSSNSRDVADLSPGRLPAVVLFSFYLYCCV